MKKIIYTSIFLISLSLISCNKDIGEINVTYQEANAVYGDLEEVRALPLNEVAREITNPGKIYVSEQYIFLGEEEKGIHVIDNSNPTAPITKNFIQIPGNREFFVKGNFLYAESYYDLLKIDISNPEQVALENRAENVFQDIYIDENGKTLLGFSFTEVNKSVNQDSDLYNEILNDNIVYLDFAKNIIPKSAVPSSFAGNSDQQSGTVNRITYSKNHIYIIGNTNLSIVDDSGSSFEKVELSSSFWPANDMETIFPYEDKLFVGSRSSMVIYDISNPKQPYEDYVFDHATSCDPVFPIDDVVYITLRTGDFSACPGNTNSLIVMDIAELNDPEELHDIEMTSPYGMTLINDLLYIGEGANGLTVFDATDRQNPVLKKKINEVKAYDVIQHPGNSNILLIATTNGLEQYEINENFDLSFESRIDY